MNATKKNIIIISSIILIIGIVVLSAIFINKMFSLNPIVNSQIESSNSVLKTQENTIKTQQETINKLRQDAMNKQQEEIKSQQEAINKQKEDIQIQQDIVDKQNKQKEIATPQPVTPKSVTPKPSVKTLTATSIPKKAMTANQAIALVLKNKFQNRIEFDAVSWGIDIDKGVKCYQIKVTNMEIAKDGGTGSEGIFAVDIYTGKIWEWESVTYN